MTTSDISPFITVEAVVADALRRGVVDEAPSKEEVAGALMKAGAKPVMVGKVCVGYHLPPLAEARRAFAENMGLGDYRWPEAEGWKGDPNGRR